MNVCFITHADFETPGSIKVWMDKYGHQTKTFSPFKGDRLPSYDKYDLLIVMGGPQSPLHLEKDPYLKDEIAFIEQFLSLNKPALGFCLGAQLIGEAFGGKTERSPYPEIGVFPIKLTKTGRSDVLLKGLPEIFDVCHWHNDMPGITSDSTILASSEGCPRQIVRYSKLAYGFQCHPEMRKSDIEAVLKACPQDLKEGSFIQTSEQLLTKHYPEINKKMNSILDNLQTTFFC